MRTISILVFTLLFAVTVSSAKIIKVPQDYAKIQLAIEAAVNGDTVLVSEGIYFENLLIAKKIVLGSLYIVDGDTSHVTKTIIDGSNPTNTDSASTITLGAATDTTLVLCGFTIRGGKGTQVYYATWKKSGGGIQSSVGGSARIVRNIITDNSLTSGQLFGGGIAMAPKNTIPGLQIIIEYNIIRFNSVQGTQAEAGGLYLSDYNARIRGNIIENNLVSAPGRNWATGGGCILQGPVNGNIVFNENIVRRNTSSYNGAGLQIYGVQTTDAPSVTVVNNLIVGNTAVEVGGGITVNIGCKLLLINNTVADNSAGVGSGLWLWATSSTNPPVVGINNIFWNKGDTNTAMWGIRFDSFHHNLIRGESACGEKNFSTDPQFVDDGSYNLAVSSPCIAAGTTSRTVLGTPLLTPSIDLYGNQRIQPDATAPDLGAIESNVGTTAAERPHRAIGHSFLFDGLVRSYAVIRPKGHEAETNQGVIIFLHGYDAMINTFNINYFKTQWLGDSLKFLTVFPEAYDARWNSGIGDNYQWPTPSTNDIGFISAVIDSLYKQYGIDTNRIYIVGHSNGAFMAYLLAAKLAHRIRAVAAVSGLLAGSTEQAYSAARKIPIMMINSTGDPWVPFGGQTGWHGAEYTLNFWRTKNNATVSVDTLLFTNQDPNDGSTVARYRYQNANGRWMVWFYKITGGSHEWPNGPAYLGADVITRDIDANREIYNFISDPVTSIKQQNIVIPLSYALSQNYPNPFNPTTTIRYALPTSAHVKLTIHDILGREITTLVNEVQSAGWREVEWNANGFASGMYLVRMQAGSFVDTKKILLMK